MIYKELDPFDPAQADRFEKAGRQAEEQMAFYLKRFFARSEEVDVLHGLRIVLEGEVAQMDHLLLMPHGLVIVESKSISGEVVIGDSGQWVRRWAGGEKGMRSPIMQARMQGMLLKDLLLEGVKPEQRAVMARLDVDVLVAISDEGVIRWPSSGPWPEVCKADQVPERALARLKATAEAQAGQPRIWNGKNRKIIADYLIRKHQPRGAVAEVSAPSVAPKETVKKARPVNAVEGPTQVAAKPAPSLAHPERGLLDTLTAQAAQTLKDHETALPSRACRHCHSYEVSVEYGHNYYLKCQACGGNTALKFACPACGQEGRLRKAGRQFFAECRNCDASQLFFTNP